MPIAARDVMFPVIFRSLVQWCEVKCDKSLVLRRSYNSSSRSILARRFSDDAVELYVDLQLVY